MDRQDQIKAHARECALDAVANGWWDGDSVYGIPSTPSEYQPDEFSSDWEDFCERFGEDDNDDEFDGRSKRRPRVSREDARVWERAWWRTLWEEGWRLFEEMEHVAVWNETRKFYDIGDSEHVDFVSPDGERWGNPWDDEDDRFVPADEIPWFRHVRKIRFRGGPRDGQVVDRQANDE